MVPLVTRSECTLIKRARAARVISVENVSTTLCPHLPTARSATQLPRVADPLKRSNTGRVTNVSPAPAHECAHLLTNTIPLMPLLCPIHKAKCAPSIKIEPSYAVQPVTTVYQPPCSSTGGACAAPSSLIQVPHLAQCGDLNPETIRPLAMRAEAWEAIQGMSEWVLNTTEHSYSLQFARRPPRFLARTETRVNSEAAHLLHAENSKAAAQRGYRTEQCFSATWKTWVSRLTGPRAHYRPASQSPSWDRTGLGGYVGQIIGAARAPHPSSRRILPGGQPGSAENIPANPGAYGLICSSASAGLTAHAPASTLAESARASPSLGGRRLASQGESRLHFSPTALAGSRIVSHGSDDGSDLAPEGCLDRCFQPRLGSALRRQTGLWPLVRPGESPSHKLSRDARGRESAQALPPSPPRSPCSSQHGQYINSGLREPPGRRQIQNALHPGGTPPRVGSALTALAVPGHACAWAPERGSRQTVQGQCSPWGVVLASPNSPVTVAPFRQSESRPLASKDNAHCPKFFTKNEDALAQQPTICLPAGLSVATSHQENQGSAPHGAPHSPVLGEPDLVPGANTAGRHSPLADSGEKRPSLSSPRLDLASPSRALVSACMETQRIPVDLPEGVVNTITQSRAPSTRRLYTSKGSVFKSGALPRGWIHKHVGYRRAQVISLSALPPSGSEVDGNLLCPVRALRNYVTRSAAIRRLEQLFVSFGGRTKGLAASKHSLSRWIVDAIAAAYASKNLQCPLGIRAHSTRGMASSWAWSSGISIHDICTAAGWVSPSTFVRFYDLEVPALQTWTGSDLSGVALEFPVRLGLDFRLRVESPAQALHQGQQEQPLKQRLKKKLQRFDEKREEWVVGRKKNHNTASIKDEANIMDYLQKIGSFYEYLCEGWTQDSSGNEDQLITLQLTPCEASPTGGQVEQPESTEGQVEQPESTEGQVEQAESTEGQVEQAESTEGQVEQPESTEGQVGPPPLWSSGEELHIHLDLSIATQPFTTTTSVGSM
ncbi:unnamed protein product [Leuciscus chuanchicus]